MANLPFDIANFNLTNFANIYPDLMDSTPQDVTYQYKDSNGNILTKTIANRGKFQDYVWSDAKSALYKVYYVDPVNGDDGNDGLSTSTAFATLKQGYSGDKCGRINRFIK